MTNTIPQVRIALTTREPDHEDPFDVDRHVIDFDPEEYDREDAEARDMPVRALFAFEALRDGGFTLADSSRFVPGVGYEIEPTMTSDGCVVGGHARLDGFHPHEEAIVYEAITGRSALR